MYRVKHWLAFMFCCSICCPDITSQPTYMQTVLTHDTAKKILLNNPKKTEEENVNCCSHATDFSRDSSILSLIGRFWLASNKCRTFHRVSVKPWVILMCNKIQCNNYQPEHSLKLSNGVDMRHRSQGIKIIKNRPQRKISKNLAMILNGAKQNYKKRKKIKDNRLGRAGG